MEELISMNGRDTSRMNLAWYVSRPSWLGKHLLVIGETTIYVI
jgi:hypothetical protein